MKGTCKTCGENITNAFGCECIRARLAKKAKEPYQVGHQLSGDTLYIIATHGDTVRSCASPDDAGLRLNFDANDNCTGVDIPNASARLAGSLDVLSGVPGWCCDAFNRWKAGKRNASRRFQEHEILHTAGICQDMFARSMSQREDLVLYPDVYAAADRAMTALCELYQVCGEAFIK